MLNRRTFVKVAGLLGLSSFLTAIGRSQDLSVLDYSESEYHVKFARDQIRVLQGVTNIDSTVLTVVAHREANLQIEILDSFRKQVPFKLDLIDLKLGDFVVQQIFVDGLLAEEKYTLAIVDRSLNKSHKKSFKTLNWSKADTKIAILTCANHRDAKPKTLMFSQLAKAEPDVIFFAGDLVYANSALDTVMNRPASPENAYNVYTKTVMEFDLYERDQLIPIFTTWDDHDLAYNNANINHPHKKIMRDVFRAFFPVDTRVKGISEGPGISFSFQAFGMHTFFFDARYYKNNGAQELLGRVQMQWFKSEVQNSNGPLILILSQQFLNYRSLAESFQKNAPREFNEFLGYLKDQNRPVLFVSGDVHYSQIQELPKSIVGHKTYEVTSSAFFSSSARSFGKRDVEDGQLAYYGYPNFVMLEKIEAQPQSLKFKLSCISEKSQSQFVKNLEIKT